MAEARRFPVDGRSIEGGQVSSTVEAAEGSGARVKQRRADTVFLTGGSGFIGSHILAELVRTGYGVKMLVRPGSNGFDTKWKGIGRAEMAAVDVVVGDVRRAGDLAPHLSRCRFLIHAAAEYTFSPARRSAIWETNVQGTASMMEAARLAGVERAVFTSSSATVGPAVNERLATEDDWALSHEHGSEYHDSKVEAERAAMAAQVPVVALLPTAPVGAGDWKPTPTGKMIVDFMRGRIFGSLPGGLNVVPVRDVARAHVTALTRGVPGERYIVGGSNLQLSELWTILARLSKRTPPRLRVPYPVALGVAMGDELRSRITEAEPVAPLEGVRMARDRMWVSTEKARRELAFEASSIEDALREAISWYRQNGYV